MHVCVFASTQVCICRLREGFVPLWQVVFGVLQSSCAAFVVVHLCMLFELSGYLHLGLKNALTHTYAHIIRTHTGLRSLRTEFIQKIALYVFPYKLEACMQEHHCNENDL